MKPIVSVIIPTFNRMEFLGETLDSVLSQSYPHWECIVVDDGSGDTTLDLLKFYCKKDGRITFWKRPLYISKGAASCRNFGFQKSRGKFVMWLDDDDLLDKDKLKTQVTLGEENANALITCGWGRFSTMHNFALKDLEIYRNYSLSIDLLRDYGKFDCFFPCHAFLLPRGLIEMAGLWRTDLLVNDDGEFFSRIIRDAHSVLFAEKTYVQYRHHQFNRVSAVNSLEKAKDLLKSWQLIKENFTSLEQKKVYQYLSNGKRHSYILLKTNGFKNVIFKHFWLFKVMIFKDALKKLKGQWVTR